MAGAEPNIAAHMTAAEFMDWDGGGHLGKLELVNGEVRAMSPATPTHGFIQANLTFLIGSHLRATGLPCRVGTEAPVAPQLHANDNVRVPDLVVTCAQPSASKFVSEPILIIEVMSPSNKRETWESIYAMSTIPTLKEIAVVDSETVRVDVFRRGAEGDWPKDGESVGPGAIVRLTSIKAEFSIDDIYAGTHLNSST